MAVEVSRTAHDGVPLGLVSSLFDQAFVHTNDLKDLGKNPSHRNTGAASSIQDGAVSCRRAGLRPLDSHDRGHATLRRETPSCGAGPRAQAS